MSKGKNRRGWEKEEEEDGGGGGEEEDYDDDSKWRTSAIAHNKYIRLHMQVCGFYGLAFAWSFSAQWWNNVFVIFISLSFNIAFQRT